MESICEVWRRGLAAGGAAKGQCRGDSQEDRPPLRVFTRRTCANVGRIPVVRLHIAFIVLAGALVYGNSLSGPLLFDDETSILNNTQIRRLSPVSVPLSPPADTPVAGRPLVNLTFALNYARGGLDVTGYHVVNVALHLLSALLLYGLVRRALGGPRVGPLLGEDADVVALAAALVWVVHPLNTETVSYVTQRSEGLMALCYLATVYASLRAATAAHAVGWTVAAVLASAAGMASKESMVTVPVVVMLFDRIFLYGSWREAWSQRARLYGGLVLSWAVLAMLMLSGPRSTVGFGTDVTVGTYFLNQLEVVARYLWLSMWPQALVLDYGLPRPVGVWDVLVPGVVVVALGLLTLVALWKRPMVGFLGAWFFITLAPTSSMVPIATEVGAERRMYLPMAALAVGAVLLLRWVVVGGDAAARRARWRLALAVVGVVCLLLGVRTFLRNQEYGSRLVMAQTIVDRRPHGRGRFLLADELIRAGRHEQGVEQLRLATTDYPQAHFGLATEMLAGGRMAEAVTEAQTFITLVPTSPVVPAARDLMGQALAIDGKLDLAAEQFTELTRVTPLDPGPFVRLGNLRLRQRRFDEGIAHYLEALRLRPDDPEVLKQLGLAFSAANRMDEAIGAFGRGVEVRPNDISLLNFLGRVLGAQGRYADAVQPMRRLVELAPSDVQARQNLALMERLAAEQAARPQAR